MIRGSGSYINPLAKPIRGRTSGAAAAGMAASMAGAMKRGRGQAPVSDFVPAVQGVAKPKPQPPTTYTDQPQPPSAYLDQLETDGRKSIPPPFNRVKMPNTEKYETFEQLPYQVPSDEPVVGMPKYNNAPKLLRDLEPSFDARAADEMRGVMRKSVQPPAGMRGAIEEAQTVGPSGGSFDFSRMSDMVDRIRQPDREYSYKRGGYVSKDNKLNLGSGRVSTASKGKKSSNW